MGDEIWRLSALEAREGLDAGAFTSEALVGAYFDRMSEMNGTLNAVVHRFDDAALTRAKEADAARAVGELWGPLHGLPVTIKESMSTAGVASTMGLVSRRDQPAPEDAVTVKLLKEAGAIVIGKTNVPQFLLCNETTNFIWGTTRNPFDLTRVPGGSSGGEAAAIASGMSLWGVGTDIGGSIRVPAAYCGIAALKPTVDRWSNVGSYTALMGQEVIRGQCGPMARTAADVAFMFRAIDGPLHSPHDPGVPPLTTTDPETIDLSRLRVGYFSDDGYLPAARSLARAVTEATELLGACGAELRPYSPPSQPELMDTYYGALSSDGGEVIKRLAGRDEVIGQLKQLRRTAELPAPLRKTAAWILGRKGEARMARLLSVLGPKPVHRYWDLTSKRTALRLEALKAWDAAGLDVVICPAHATPALAHMQSADFSTGGTYAMRYNLLNFPAGVVGISTVRPTETERAAPTDRVERAAAAVEEGTAGLPLGVQVVARPFREDLVLAVMMALEAGAREKDDFPLTPVVR